MQVSRKDTAGNSQTSKAWLFCLPSSIAECQVYKADRKRTGEVSWFTLEGKQQAADRHRGVLSWGGEQCQIVSPKSCITHLQGGKLDDRTNVGRGREEGVQMTHQVTTF